MNNIDNLFSSYFDIINNTGFAKYLQTKHIPVSFKKLDSTKILWEKHKKSQKSTKIKEIPPKQSLLDLKIEITSRILKNCSLCERRCGIDRTKQPGNCNVQQSRVTTEFLHLGEESILVPSHTIFFSGCTFHCVFCQNWDISQRQCGVMIEPKKLSEIIKTRYNQGAKNVNWVGGDPTSNLLFILETLKHCDINIPQVWNSNMYYSIETMKLLEGIIDIYLSDFKYGNDTCAKRLSKVENYTEIVRRNHKFAHDTSELIIRHLVMPNHIKCCSKQIIKWISQNLSNGAVNIMAQYRPEYNADEYEDISRPLSQNEYNTVKKYAHEYELNEV